MGAVAVGVAIGAVVGGASAAIQSGGNFDAIWKGALVGAVSGAAGGAIAGWAAPALAPALGSFAGTAAGALGGLAAGVIGGVGTTALNGGNGSDYLRASLMGGATGAVLGGASGAIGNLGANGEMAAPQTQPLDMSTATSVEGPAVPIQEASSGATGIGGNELNGANAVNESVTGQISQPTPAYTTPQLDTSTQPLQYASNQTTTDVPLGSSAEPQLLPGGVDMNASATKPASLSNLYNVDTATGSYGPNGEVLGTWDNNLNAYADPTKANMDTANASYGSKGELKGLWDTEQNMYSNQPGFKIGEGNTGGWNMPKETGMDYKDMLGKAMQGQMMGNALKGIGSVAGYGEAKQNKQQLMDLYNQQNAYNQQVQGQNAQVFNQNLAANTANQQAFRDQLAAAQGYNTQLQNTYTNPNEYLNTPEAQATRSLAMQKLLAQNAMAGRRSNGLALQNQLMMNQLQNAQAYRNGLRQAIQYPNQAPSMGYQSLTNPVTTLNSAQAQSPVGNVMAGLGSMFAPAATYYMMMPNG